MEVENSFDNMTCLIVDEMCQFSKLQTFQVYMVIFP